MDWVLQFIYLALTLTTATTYCNQAKRIGQDLSTPEGG